MLIISFYLPFPLTQADSHTLLILTYFVFLTSCLLFYLLFYLVFLNTFSSQPVTTRPSSSSFLASHFSLTTHIFRRFPEPRLYSHTHTLFILLSRLALFRHIFPSLLILFYLSLASLYPSFSLFWLNHFLNTHILSLFLWFYRIIPLSLLITLSFSIFLSLFVFTPTKSLFITFTNTYPLFLPLLNPITLPFHILSLLHCAFCSPSKLNFSPPGLPTHPLFSYSPPTYIPSLYT